jgi:hypothetical protein
MNDCPNADLRDQLPDLLHERLEASARAVALAHVADCVDCRAELELLRRTRRLVMAATPPVDVEGIVMALPHPRQAPSRAARRWMDWRMAAAVAVFAVGAGSLVVVTRGGNTGAPDVASPSVQMTQAPVAVTPTPVSVAAASEPAQPAAAKQQVAAATSPAAPPDAGIAMTGRLGDLSEQQLRALLKDIENMQAVPTTEPEPVTLPVTSGTGRSGEEL